MVSHTRHRSNRRWVVGHCDGTRIGKVTLSVDPDTFEVTAHAQQNVERTTTAPATLIASYPRVAEVNAIVTTAARSTAAVGDAKVGSVSADITTAYVGGCSG